MITIKQLAQRLRMCANGDAAWMRVRDDLRSYSIYEQRIDNPQGMCLPFPHNWGYGAFLYADGMFGVKIGKRVTWGVSDAVAAFSFHVAEREAQSEGA